MFLDKDLKNIIAMMPAKSLSVVSKTELMSAGLSVLAEMQNSESRSADFAALQKSIDFVGVELSPHPLEHSLVDQDDGTLKENFGFQILRLYFHQIYRVRVAHLDLRPRYFAPVSDDKITWHPSALRFAFDAKFLRGVRHLYEGFYLSQAADFSAGLRAIGLLNDQLSTQATEQITKVFFEHFGEGQHAPIKFSVEKLKNSFDAIFSVLYENEIKVNPQFAFLGVMLTTMYTTLEKVKDPVNVRAAFMDRYKSV